MKYCFAFLIALILFNFSLIEAQFTLKQRIINAQAGDFTVTVFGEHYSLLLLRFVSKQQAIIEEISIASGQINPKNHSWKTWVEQNAPGHSRWLIYYIDLEQSKLTRCEEAHSHIEVPIDTNDYFLAKLLTLPLMSVESSQRKRIGPPPLEGDVDRRKIWNPLLIFEGKKIKEAHFSVWEGKWPHDQSLLAGTKIEIYLDQTHLNFAFPYWIEIKGTAVQLHVHVADSGKGLISPTHLSIQ